MMCVFLRAASAADGPASRPAADAALNVLAVRWPKTDSRCHSPISTGVSREFSAGRRALAESRGASADLLDVTQDVFLVVHRQLPTTRARTAQYLAVLDLPLGLPATTASSPSPER